MVDVGANIGTFLIAADRWLREHSAAREGLSTCHVYGFEPVPSLLVAAAQNVALHALHTRVAVRDAATAGSIPAEHGRRKRRRADDSASPSLPPPLEGATEPSLQLLPVALCSEEECSGGTVSLHHYPHLPGNSTTRPHEKAAQWEALALPADWTAGETLTCAASTLGRQLRVLRVARVDLLKVDAEGVEEAVLASLDRQQWRGVRQVVAEVHDVAGRAARVQAMLRGAGLRVVVERPAFARRRGLDNLMVYAWREAAEAAR